MENFQYLYNAKFNNKRFLVFSNKNYGIYVLEIHKDGKLCYPQYEDFIGFYKKFQEFTSRKVKYSLDIESENSQNTENGMSLNPKNEPKKTFFSFVPKVIRNGILISVLAAMFLAGCANPSEATVEATEDVEIMQEAESAGFNAEYVSELERYITKSYYSNEEEKDVIICVTNEEMKSYFPDKIQNPTYDDVKNTIQQNEKIPDKYKEKYMEMLSKMEKELPNLDLFLLNLNAERMAVKERKSLGNALGTFIPSTGLIQYVEEASDFVIAHELGHGALSGEFDLGDVIVKKYFEFPELKRTWDSDDSRYYYYTLISGSIVEDAAVDMLAQVLTGETQLNKRPYAPIDYHVEMYMKACNYTLSELLNEGVLGLAEAMGESDINDPIEYMLHEDHLISRYNVFDYDEDWPQYYGVTINNIPKWFFEDWSEEKYARGEEGIEERVEDIITSTSFTDGVYFVYGSGDEQRTVDSSTPEELMVIVNEALVKADEKTVSGIGDFFEDFFR